MFPYVYENDGNFFFYHLHQNRHDSSINQLIDLVAK